jgi:hypothetical protein
MMHKPLAASRQVRSRKRLEFHFASAAVTAAVHFS